MLSRTTPTTPTICPVPLPILRKHANIVQTYTDDLLLLYATAATEIAESATNRYFLQRQISWVLTTDARQSIYSSLAVTLQNYFNSYMHPWLHCPHSAISVDSVSLGTWGVTPDVTLVQGTDYYADVSTDPARIQLLSFDAFQANVDHLTTTYHTGYGTSAETVPKAIQQAIMLLTTRLYQQRGDEVGALWSSGAEALLAPYTVFQFGAASDLYSA
jgi:hypothetical protein